MIWVDTTAGRGNGGATRLASGTIGGIPMTYYLYGGNGGLPIIKLNSNRKTGTINLLDGLRYFEKQGVLSKTATLNQLNFGWEICSTGSQSETFRLSSYSLTATHR